MIVSLAFFLLGFAAAAFGQLAPLCSCVDLKNCLDTQRQDMRRKHTDCVAVCKSKLPGDSNAAAGCVNQQREDMDAMKKTEVKCLLDSTSGTCRSESARVRRQLVVPLGESQFREANTNTNAQGGGLQVQSPNTNAQAQRGGLQVQTQVQSVPSASTSSVDTDVDGFIKTFHDCVRNCTKNEEPATGTAGPQAADEAAMKHMRGIESCAVKLGCSFTVASVNQAARSCRTNMTFEMDNRMKGVKLRYCNCVRDALGKTADEVPCMSSRG